MAWDKKCKTRYANRRGIYEKFKARYNIKSCLCIGAEHSLDHLKGVLRTGMDVRRRNFLYASDNYVYFVRDRKLQRDEYLHVDISDHAAYFKTTDSRVMYVSQPYGELEDIAARVKDWDKQHGLKVEIFGPEYSWYNEHSNLVLITLI